MIKKVEKKEEVKIVEKVEPVVVEQKPDKDHTLVGGPVFKYEKPQ